MVRYFLSVANRLNQMQDQTSSTFEKPLLEGNFFVTDVFLKCFLSLHYSYMVILFEHYYNE